MITKYPYAQLGHADHGWLDARHHFSFAAYRNPERNGFGSLLVINDDIIKAGTGFDTHSHKNMEIITYVRKGAITHKDSNGNEGRTSAGDVQVMSAGTGIFHSEFNLESEDTNLYQIWIEPNKLDVTPSWDSSEFPKDVVADSLTLLVSGDGSAPLRINQDASIYGGTITAGSEIEHSIKHQVYLLVSEGSIEIEGQVLDKGDGAEVENASSMLIKALQDSEILLLDVPAQQNN